MVYNFVYGVQVIECYFFILRIIIYCIKYFIFEIYEFIFYELLCDIYIRIWSATLGVPNIKIRCEKKYRLF
jgi:hypothetical protein